MSIEVRMGWSELCLSFRVSTIEGGTVPPMCSCAAAGLACGVLAWAGRRALGASWRFRPSWALWPAPVAVTAVIELAGLAGLVRTAARSDTGRLRTIELPEEDPPLSAGREAAATLALCSTPGSQVAHLDPEEHTMIVHELLSLGPDLDSMVRR
jgi:hypothetical protein